jgi:hypothetical protein
MSRKKFSILVGSRTDGFGDNANSSTEHPQRVHDAVERYREEQEEREKQGNARRGWLQMNAMADSEFFGGGWKRWVKSPECPLKDGCYLMPWQNTHWALVLICKDITGIKKPDGSQDLFPRKADHSELWLRPAKSSNVTLHGRCPSWCPGCKGDFPGCGRKLLADDIQSSFKTVVDELLVQKRMIQELAKTRARCKGPYCAAEKKMKIAKEKSDDAAAKIAKDESDRLHEAYNEAGRNYQRAAAIYKEIFNRWREMFNMDYFPRSFYKLAPPLLKM